MRKIAQMALIALILPQSALGADLQAIDPQSAPFHAKFDDRTDDTAALNAALQAAAGKSGAGAVVKFPPNAIAKVSGNLSLDISKVRLDCQGATIDASSAKSGATFTLTSSADSPNQMGGIHNAHPVRNCLLSGPDSSAGVDAFHFVSRSIGGLPWITGIVIDGVSATGYRNFIQTGPGTVNLTVQNGTFGGDRHQSGTFWDVVAGTNTGENFHAVNFFVANAGACFNDHDSNASNVDIFAVNFSCDATRYILSGGAVPGKGSSFMTLFYSGHIEDVLAQDYAINIGNGGFDFQDGEWIGTRRGDQTHVLCKVNGLSSGSEIGVRIGNVEFNDNGGTFAPFGQNRLWCDGAGPFRVTGASALGNTAVGLFAYANNQIANYDNPSLGDFSITGTVTSDKSVKPSGAVSSLHLTAASSASGVTASRLCRPGDIAAVGATIETAGIAAGHGGASIQVGYLSAGGRLLASNQIDLKTDLPSFTARQIVPVQLPAPPGTVSCRALFEVAAPGAPVQMWVAYPQLIVQ